MTFTTGDTVRLQATFKDFDGNLAAVTTPILKIYDSNERLITSTAALVNPSTGVYYYDYTIPKVKATYIYEFSGTSGSTLVLRREKFSADTVGT
jgi:hypothetical protein